MADYSYETARKIVTSGAERNTNCTVRLNVAAKLYILGEVVIVKIIIIMVLLHK